MATSGYLHPSTSSFRRIFLYHSFDDSGGGGKEGRALTALVFLDGTNADWAGGKAGAKAGGGGGGSGGGGNGAGGGNGVAVDARGRLVYPSARAALWLSHPYRSPPERPPVKKLLRDFLARHGRGGRGARERKRKDGEGRIGGR